MIDCTYEMQVWSETIVFVGPRLPSRTHEMHVRHVGLLSEIIGFVYLDAGKPETIIENLGDGAYRMVHHDHLHRRLAIYWDTRGRGVAIDKMFDALANEDGPAETTLFVQGIRYEKSTRVTGPSIIPVSS